MENPAATVPDQNDCSDIAGTSPGAPKASNTPSIDRPTPPVMSLAIPIAVHARIESISASSEVREPVISQALSRAPIGAAPSPKQALPPMTLPSFPHHLFGEPLLEPPLSIWGTSDMKLKSYNQQFTQLLGFDAALLAKRDLQIGDLFSLRGASQSELVDSSRDRVIQAHVSLRADESRRIEVLLISLVNSASEFKTLQITMVPLAGNERVLWVTEDISSRTPHQLNRSPSPITAPSKPVEYHFDSPPWKPKESAKKRERKERPWDTQMVKFTIEPPANSEKPTAEKPQSDRPL